MASSPDYAGDLSAEEAFEVLSREPGALLVDVRSRAEWTFVGLPDLSSIGKEPLLVEWQSYPAMTVSEDFMPAITEAVSTRGGDHQTPLLFLCRSGGRSQAAAIAMTAVGFRRCFNITGGFEGRLDGERHRGALDGWKAAGLPWVQS